LAALLFGLAAQQEDEHALESLSRVEEFEASQGLIVSQEEIEQSPVVAVARTVYATICDITILEYILN
jgi:hypothetical protein